MKDITRILIGLCFITFIATPSMAFYDNVIIGDSVKLTTYGANGGGIFDMVNVTPDPDYNWESFCTDLGNHISPNTLYTVSGFLALDNLRTDYLYWNFRNGTLSGTYAGTIYDWDGSTDDESDLQKLIWNLESTGSYSLSNQMQAWYNAADYAVNNGWGDHGIRQLNLGENVQTTLVATPIPGAVWLLGSGLLGLAGIRRRRRN